MKYQHSVTTSVRAVTTENPPALADVVRVLEQMYDPAWARDWDAVGLVCGDPDAPVRRILLAVDPVAAVVDEALAWHADLVLTHHPLLLQGVHGVAATTAKGRVIHRLVRSGTALYTAHTNADAAAPGVSDALARVLGLTDLEPLSADPPDPMDKIVTFVPPEAVDSLVDALAKSGAGDLGRYSRCAWTGTFVLGGSVAPASSPALGRHGSQTDAPEQRVEMVMPRSARPAVVAVLRAVHPYEEPAFDVYELASWSGPRGIGRVGRLSAATSLREFAMLVAEALPAAAQGVRVAGDPTAPVQRVAVCGGAGDSLLDAVRASGAEVT
jgi:dinuclear metal center YbgI/SA1388 family protein